MGIYSINVEKRKAKSLIATQQEIYEGFPITLGLKQKQEVKGYMEKLGVIEFWCNLRVDAGFLFKCDFNEKYPEDFLSYNLHNTIEDNANPLAKIGLCSDSLSGFGATEYVNQDNKCFNLVRKLNPEADTKDMLFFYEYYLHGNTNLHFSTAFKKGLDPNKKKIALFSLMSHVQNLLAPLDNIISNIANPDHRNVVY